MVTTAATVITITAVFTWNISWLNARTGLTAAGGYVWLVAFMWYF